MEGSKPFAASCYSFKNGFSLVCLTYLVPPNTQEFKPDLLLSKTSPVHGSLWFDGDVESVNLVEKDRGRVPESAAELLEASVGETVEVFVSLTKEWMKGRNAGVSGRSLRLEGEAGSLVCVDVSNIIMVRGVLADATFKPKNPEHRVVVRMHARPDETSLQARFICRGMTWAPSYKMVLHEDPVTVTLEKHKTLEVSAQATFLNDVLDLGDLPLQLNLLAGVPNLQFENCFDPLTSGQTMEHFLASLSSSGSAGGMATQRRMAPAMTNNIMMQQAMPMPGGGGGGGSDEATSNANDLHVYSFKDVLCDKGNRVVLPLFPKARGLDFNDIHEVEISLANRARASGDSNDVPVHHSIEFKNLAEAPWSTGPVLVLRGNDQQLVCQSSCSYTPVGAESKVKLTKSLQVAVYHNVHKVDRTSKTKHVLNHSYLETVASGSILIKNSKNEALEVKLKITLQGDLVKTSIKPDTSTESPSNDLVNASRIVTFKINLEPGKAETLEYSRKYFLKN